MRWPEAERFSRTLTDLTNYHTQAKWRVDDILAANHHWQGLLGWLRLRTKGSQTDNNDALGMDWLARLEETRPDIYDAIPLLRNEHVREMIRAAQEVAGATPTAPDSRLVRWREECRRSFLDELQPERLDKVNPLVKVPVVLTYGKPEPRGLAWLELETLAGEGDTIPHPGDVWRTRLMDEGSAGNTFAQAMRMAFQGAREISMFDEPVRGRWRIVDRDGVPVPAVSGESAGGAALLGWLRAMTLTAVDQRVLIMAAVRQPTARGQRWRLDAVGGLEEKVSTVIDANMHIDKKADVAAKATDNVDAHIRRVDTIGTVRDCVARAREALRDRADIRIVELSTEIDFLS
jgi:hypothetical protein